MKQTIILTALLMSSIAMFAQSEEQDTVFTRNVTVEREFQPTIRSAGKISTRPNTIEEDEISKPEVQYSDYTSSLTPSYNLSPLPAQRNKFTPIKPLHGYLKAAVGHPQTLLDFGYEHVDKTNSMKIGISHEQDWGLKAVGETGLNFRFAHKYTTGQIYFDVTGANEYFTRYGRYYNPTLNPENKAWTNGLSIDRHHELNAYGDKQTVWRGEVLVGAKSNNKTDFQYLAEVSYKAYAMTSIVTEHQINARFNFSYQFLDDHKAGLKFYSQNQIQVAGDTMLMLLSNGTLSGTYNNRYCIRMEPFYEYVGRRVLVHVGVNLNMNIGKGNLMSGTTDSTPYQGQVAFAPSPNIHMEAQLAPKWCVLYLDAKGKLGFSNQRGYTQLCLYQNMFSPIFSHHVSSYTPVDAEVGFRFRPDKNLILNVHGGYAYRMNEATFGARVPGDYIKDFDFVYSDFQQIKLGAELEYHYRDIVRLHAWGDYYFYAGVTNNTANKPGYAASNDIVYDRPSWKIGADVDYQINRHWAVYMNGRFEGSRHALVASAISTADVKLPALLNIDLGARYQFAGTKNEALNRLSIFAELQNVLHRKHQYWYGYQTEGIHGRIGVSWRF